MSSFKVGLIGCGSMGSALIKGMVEKKVLLPSDIIVFDKEIKKAHLLLKNFNIKTANSADEICENVSTLFIAVKPQDFDDLLLQINEWISIRHIIVSIAAGISCRHIEERLNESVRVIRIMPNTPCLIGEGMIAISAGKYAGQDEIEYIAKLVKSIGRVQVIKENLMDAVTGLSGSGPAYIYLIIEALADGGVEAGLSYEVALELAAQTVKGAAGMVQVSGEHPAKLKNMVTSPGGTTSAGLMVLEEEGVRSSLMKAVVTAAKRAKLIQ